MCHSAVSRPYAEHVSQYENLGLPLIHAGKVRELYALDDPGKLLMVATDNISAYDFVLEPAVPGKGIVLTQLSLWWFGQLADLIDNHLISTDVPAAVAGRAMITERLDMVPIEAVARGYLTGSGWIEYQDSGTVCGVQLPAGLHDGSRLAEPIFTPARKAELGEHDENISFEQMCAEIGDDLGAKLRDATLSIYRRAEQITRERGIILADTKLEFGLRADGTLVLADEVLTPDSSRFWDAREWEHGRLASFDKQYLRDWLAHDSDWDRSGSVPPPPLPPHIVEKTRERYLLAFQRLTGDELVLN